MNNFTKAHSWTAILSLAVLLILTIVLPTEPESALMTGPVSLKITEADIGQEAVVLSKPETDSQPSGPDRWLHVKIKSGDNLAKIFQRLDLPAADLQKIVAIGSKVSSLRKILPMQELSFQVTDTGTLAAIRYKKDPLDTLLITRNGTGFVAEWETAVPEVITAYATGSITKQRPSFYRAGKAAGVSDHIIMKLSYIFQWDISFAWDIREGDSFSLMYEELYVEGEKVEEGDIIAAVFTNAGKVHHALQYSDVSGRSDYYTPDGHSLRKAFIRDPVHFSHVSSSFNLRRLHPVHKRVMPHRGLDYAARKGTPILASGDGRVITRKQNSASGKYVVIQHGEQYTTKYLHMSAFTSKARPNRFVKQGETIGYVGATGWATAPHLHYEFLVNGVHRNPKTVSLPKANPIPESEMPRFQAAVAPVLAQLKAGDRTTPGKTGAVASSGRVPAGD